MNSYSFIITRFMSWARILFLCAVVSCEEGDEIADPEQLSNNIDEELHLGNNVAEEGLPDYIVDGFLIVNADLIIDPGVCIVFTANSGLFINNGSIQAIGTAAEPIKFTGQQGVKGFWRGIQVRAMFLMNLIMSLSSLLAVIFWLLHDNRMAKAKKYPTIILIFIYAL